MERYSYYIGFGGNLGDPIETFKKACLIIPEHVGTIDKVSSLYKAKPMLIEGVSTQGVPDYYNAVIKVSSSREPTEVLDSLLKIETALGRVRSDKSKWESRPIDLDIIAIDGIIIDTPTCCVPHPEMHLRDFVLIPLLEIEPGFIHPLSKRNIHSLLEELSLESRFVLEKIS